MEDIVSLLHRQPMLSNGIFLDHFAPRLRILAMPNQVREDCESGSRKSSYSEWVTTFKEQFNRNI